MMYDGGIKAEQMTTLEARWNPGQTVESCATYKSSQDVLWCSRDECIFMKSVEAVRLPYSPKPFLMSEIVRARDMVLMC